MSTQMYEILYTDSQDMLALSSTVHRATTTAVQMAAPVPEIKDTPLIARARTRVRMCVCL
jgi:hypothetical protein